MQAQVRKGKKKGDGENWIVHNRLAQLEAEQTFKKKNDRKYINHCRWVRR